MRIFLSSHGLSWCFQRKFVWTDEVYLQLWIKCDENETEHPHLCCYKTEKCASDFGSRRPNHGARSHPINQTCTKWRSTASVWGCHFVVTKFVTIWGQKQVNYLQPLSCTHERTQSSPLFLDVLNVFRTGELKLNMGDSQYFGVQNKESWESNLSSFLSFFCNYWLSSIRFDSGTIILFFIVFNLEVFSSASAEELLYPSSSLSLSS